MEIQKKAKLIKLLILDVDGVLTNGSILYFNDDVEIKTFHIHDGLGIKLLQKTGIKVAVISAKTSAPLLRRLKELHVEDFYLNVEDKIPAYNDLKKKLNLQDSEIAYMGDDLPDLPLLRRAGFAITVPNASSIIKHHVDLITTKKGGKGAVREVCEIILQAQAKFDLVIQSYLTK